MAEKKTIAFYCSSLTKGGAERVFANLAEYFTEKMPARACFQVAALPLGVKVEIEAIAVRQ